MKALNYGPLVSAMQDEYGYTLEISGFLMQTHTKLLCVYIVDVLLTVVLMFFPFNSSLILPEMDVMILDLCFSA
jgi:hypothetical protein